MMYSHFDKDQGWNMAKTQTSESLRIADLEKEIADPEVAGDFPVMTAKCAELDELKNLLDEKMEEWANG